MTAGGIPFTKMSAGGNDFIVLDAFRSGGHGAPLPDPEFIRRVCRRALSVGADGVIEIAPDPAADVRMSYWNADGGRAALCGNGVRCVARLAEISGYGSAEGMTILTDAGLLQAGVRGTDAWFRVPIGIPECRAMQLNIELPSGESARFDGLLVTVGVPHLVIETADAHGMPPARLALLAPPLRHHAELGPAGANVDFVSVRSRREAAIRCWERGVEGETLSSGTGCIATALALAHGGRCDDEVVLVSRSGLSSSVKLENRGIGPVQAVLCGDARLVYSARLGAEATTGFTP